MSHFLVRPARSSDIDAFLELARLSGPGFTSLPEDRERLAANLAASEASFADPDLDAAQRHYILMLEDGDGQVVGSAALKAKVGITKPFFNFKIFNVSQASFAANRRFDMDLMLLINEYAGCTEIGTLFTRPEVRGGGVGRMLGQARYMLMAAAPDWFAPNVVAELRGIVDEAGQSPFWDHLGARFFQMDFAEADRLSAVTDSQFIIDLMPKYPIYLELLHPEARAVIGAVHPDGRGAMKLLRDEGFRYERVIDIFDGGPVLSAPRSDVRTVRESRRLTAVVSAQTPAGPPVLVSNDRPQHLVVIRAAAHIDNDQVGLDAATLERLDLAPGSSVRIWLG